MISTESRLFYLFLRLIGKKGMLRKQLATGKTTFFDCAEPTVKVKKACHIQTTQVNGRNVFTLTPKNKPNSRTHILYLHGGAYIQSFNWFHWRFLAELVDETGCTITAPDYSLAPAYTHRESFAMVMEVYRNLLKTTGVDEFMLMGDSSGGGFALALAQQLQKEVLVQPGRIILLSPWLDITLTNPEINLLEGGDVFLEKQSLQQAGSLYGGGTDPADYHLSPINGPLDGLGKISLFIGSKEILVADARKLKALAEAGGIDFDYFEYENMLHAWMFLDFPESTAAKKQIIDLLL